jgi:hypothetical protein
MHAMQADHLHFNDICVEGTLTQVQEEAEPLRECRKRLPLPASSGSAPSCTLTQVQEEAEPSKKVQGKRALCTCGKRR